MIRLRIYKRRSTHIHSRSLMAARPVALILFLFLLLWWRYQEKRERLHFGLNVDHKIFTDPSPCLSFRLDVIIKFDFFSFVVFLGHFFSVSLNLFKKYSLVGQQNLFVQCFLIPFERVL